MTLSMPVDVRSRVVLDFFDAYRNHAVHAMVEMCTPDAEFRQVPFEMWGRQRVIRAEGHVATVGKILWTGLIQAFPDLSNIVQDALCDDQGNVLAEVVMSGTQSGPWGAIRNRGQRFELDQVVLFRVTDTGLIDRITSYWDNVSLHRQLGHLEVD